VSKERIKSYLLLLIVAAIWGVAGPVIKYTLPDFPPTIFLTYRFFISTILMLPIVWVFKPKFPRSKREIFMLILAGLLGSSINLGFLFYGYDKSSVLDAAILGDSAPIFVVLGGILLLKEKVTRREIWGIIITFIGTLIIVIEPMFNRGFVWNASLFGNLLIILANVAWVFYIVISKKELSHKVDNFLMTSFMFLLGFITMLPIALIQTRGLTNLLMLVSVAPLKAHLGVWYMAVLSGSLAYFLYQEGQKKIEASEATLFAYLSPLFAAPLAVFWLKEKITIPFIIGTAIVIFGVFIAEYRKGTRHDGK
jgi:drug/metabolite transporter (DMT)-like permease